MKVMHEIKFRAWREKDYNGKFEIPRGMYMVGNLPLWTLAEMDCGLEIYKKHSPETRWHDRNVRDYVLLQFTGLKDKNGKEIYEGDILRCEDLVMEVQWRPSEAQFVLYEDSDDRDIFITIHKESEVIGNIYENPELVGDAVSR